MGGNGLLRTGIVAVLACFLPGMALGLEVTPDKENVVASRLVGKWVCEARLTGRLLCQPKASSPPGETVEFTSDPTVAAKVPQKYHEPLGGKRIYLAGLMKMQGQPYPFILIQHCGNPHLIYFREQGGDPMGDAESFNLMLAPAKNPRDDLLFTGGDFNNQPFSAFERADRFDDR